MTELEKWEKRLTEAEQALEFVQHAANIDRKLSHDSHMDGHYTLALSQINSVVTNCKARVIRIRTVGR